MSNCNKLISALLTLTVAVSAMAQTESLTQYVNPFVGTDGYGNVYPGAQVPFGGIQISPDTDSDFYDAASGYKYSRPTLLGFSLTHLSGTGIPDLGDFLFIPGTGKMHLQPGTHEDHKDGYRSAYSHDRETASVNYYSVDLLDYGVKAEMTSGLRSGMFRFTYPESDESFIMIDMNHTLWQSCPWSNLRMVNDSTITGYKLVKGWRGMCISWLNSRVSWIRSESCRMESRSYIIRHVSAAAKRHGERISWPAFRLRHRKTRR